MARRVIVVGAGAAGLMAAGRAAECGADVLLLEKTSEAGKKILVTGKGRCNLTNTAPLRQFIRYYGSNGQFLRNAFHRFFRPELIDLLARYGVETKEERGGRVFPVSDDATDVRNALLRYAEGQGAEVRYRAEVNRVLTKGGKASGVLLWDSRTLSADVVILATGGASWQETGSTGEGYAMAKTLGHTIVPLRPALVPLTVEERSIAEALQGVSLRHARCTFYQKTDDGEKPLQIPYPMPEVGEMLFTHFGVSGPLILTASTFVVEALREGKPVELSIDLKPNMTEDEVRKSLQHEFERHSRGHLRTRLKGSMPSKLATVIAELSGINADGSLSSIRAEDRDRLVRLIKDFRWTISGSLQLALGMVTAGGVSLKEVDPVSFESQIVKDLHIVGELLDLAADTGGFNLQAAFSEGYLAGEYAAKA
jgi:predicted Rossmann fold flavoprotein